MRLSNCVSYVLAAALLLPAGLLAAGHNCNPGAPTPQSYNHNFAKEANQLLTNIKDQAAAVKKDAGGMALLSRFDEVDWEMNADRLTTIRADVNAMGKSLCRLNEIRSAVLPWQRQEIDRITPDLIELADSTTSAIKLLGKHERSFWATNFPNEMSYIYKDASRIESASVLRNEYAKGPTGTSSSSTSSGM
jgi:hypothetical protein